MKHCCSYFNEPSTLVLEDDTYEVVVFKLPEATRLTISRKDLKDGIPWDELQRLKNEAGFENEDAVEVYPRQRDVHYTANYRHLWICPKLLPHAWRKMEGLL